jgi:3',5'-cyclic-AMP phosphodiesterase
MLRFVHISDTHIHPDENYQNPYAQYTPLLGAKELVKQLNALPFTPDFVLHTGDVAYDPIPEAYDIVREVMSEIRYPIYYVAGNHDHRETLQTALMRRDNLQVYPHYEVEINGVQLVCVDSNANAPQDVPRGLVSDEQLDWLHQICVADDERPLVIAVHHHAVPVGSPWLDEYMRIQNGEEFHAIVRQARDRLRGVFHGHIHQNIDVLRDGVLYSAANSPWCSFMAYPTSDHTKTTPDNSILPGFSVVSITQDQTYIRRHSFRVGL